MVYFFNFYAPSCNILNSAIYQRLCFSGFPFPFPFPNLSFSKVNKRNHCNLYKSEYPPFTGLCFSREDSMKIESSKEATCISTKLLSEGNNR